MCGVLVLMITHTTTQGEDRMMDTTSIAGHLVQGEHQGDHHHHGVTLAETASAAVEAIGTNYYYYGIKNLFFHE